MAARYRKEGEERAIGIKAHAVNEHQKIMAAAHSRATEILGEAEANALMTLAAAYREDPEFYRVNRALDSYDSIIDSNTTLILPSDSALIRYLDGSEAPTPDPAAGWAEGCRRQEDIDTRSRAAKGGVAGRSGRQFMKPGARKKNP